MKAGALGARTWVVADGYIPSGGIEGDRAFESHESFSILNVGKKPARIEITLYFADRGPTGPYVTTVEAERCLHLRPTDLVDPEPVPRDTDYSAVIRSDRRVVVQHTRLDSRPRRFSLMSSMAHPAAAGIRGLGALLVLPLAGCTTVAGVLDSASRDADLIAQLSWWMFAAAVFVFVVTIGLLGAAAVIRHGDRKGVPSFRFSSGLVMAGGVVAPVAAIIAVAISGVMISDETEGDASRLGPVIEVTGRQWWWEFRYLDDTGATIAVTANEMHLPVGQRALLRLKSDNVIHSFWVPNIQGKTDLIPGRTNVLYAEPAATGRWVGQCAEFCGLQHALMRFVMVAQPLAEYEAWLARQAAPSVVTDHPGLDVFREQGCADCHTIRGTRAEGAFGPDLTHVASRQTLAAATLPNTAGNMGGWITSTHSIKPGVHMPSTAPPPEDLMALLDFLGSLE